MSDKISASRFVVASAVAVIAPVGAFIIVAVAAAPAEAGLNTAILFAVFGLPIALLHFLFLGLPAYALLSRRWRLTWWVAAIGGFAVAAIPMTLLSAVHPGFETYQAGQTMLIVNGRYTAAGYLSLLKDGGMTGLLGVAGGLAFWAVLAMKRGRPVAGPPFE